MRSLLETKKVIVCCGAGGVGKTTTSASLAVAGAMAGRNVLVLTIDPARRLAEAMGIPETSREPKRVPRTALARAGLEDAKGELYAWMLHPSAVFETLVHRLSKDESRAKAIFENRLYRHLSGLVAGMQEYTAAEALYSMVEDGRFDLVVLDTPPSRNALEFLEAPRKLASFLDERIISMFLPKGGGSGGMLKAAHGLIESVFTRIFGQGFYDELREFLSAFSGMFGGMRAHSEAVRKLLTSSASTFLLVTSPDPSALREANFFQGKIDDLKLPFGGYILNRSLAHGEDFELTEAPDGADAHLRSALTKVRPILDTHFELKGRDRRLLTDLRGRSSGGFAIATPHVGGAIEDLTGIAALATHLLDS
jgi:anion-transporting  ArsA/GET3 family ATPase